MGVDVRRPAWNYRLLLEPLFFEFGVDFWMNGHEHSYERSYPVYKGKSDRSNLEPKATIYVVTGAAGCAEMHEGFTRVAPSWSAFRSNTFGYSRMTVYNASHLHWQQVQTDPTLFGKDLYGRVIDDAWIVQHNHGPFSLAAAPTGTAWPIGDEHPSRSHEHWDAMLGQPNQNNLNENVYRSRGRARERPCVCVWWAGVAEEWGSMLHHECTGNTIHVARVCACVLFCS